MKNSSQCADCKEKSIQQSKSAKKRHSEALQKLGEELALLDSATLAALGLPNDLITSMLECRKGGKKEADRRQRQYIGRLMRELDLEELKTGIENKSAQDRLSARTLQKAYTLIRDFSDTSAQNP